MVHAGGGHSLMRAHGLGGKRSLREIPFGPGFEGHCGALSMCKYASQEHPDAHGSVYL